MKKWIDNTSFSSSSSSSFSSFVPSSSDLLDEKLKEVNKKFFGNENFRPRQLDIIKSVLSNKDVFVIMPTGGGKSLCYALPAVISKGVTVVISPLISLIEDQVSGFLSLSSCGGIPSVYLTSNCTEVMARKVYEDLNRCKSGLEPYIKLLYLTPERIVKGDRIQRILQDLYGNEMLARFIIDEAHCVSSWGHDFRKDYGRLSVLKEDYPEVPIVALTATARTKVVNDTVKILQIQDCEHFNTGFDRTNLYFEVLPKPSSTILIYKTILNYINTKFPNETGIVYCMTKRECEELSDFLHDNNITCDYYHAGQSKNERKIIQNNWLTKKINVVCATIAYGMGIDMPSVRFVLHLSLSKSLEGYYQEAGRAGRDGKYSECVLFYSPKDITKLARIIKKPPKYSLSKKDEVMLEEMKEYCDENINCRRQIISLKFGSNTSKIKKVNAPADFVSCKNICDNCKFRFEKTLRRCFIPSEISSNSQNPSSRPLLLSSASSVKKSSVNFSDDEDGRPRISSSSCSTSTSTSAKFMKASSLYSNTDTTSNNPSISSSLSSRFIKASNLINKRSLSDRESKNNSVVDLVSDFSRKK